MSNAEKKSDYIFLGCMFEQTGQYGEYWRSGIDDNGGAYILNLPKPVPEGEEPKNYTFVLTYDPKAKEKVDAYKAKKAAEKDNKQGTFNPVAGK